MQLCFLIQFSQNVYCSGFCRLNQTQILFLLVSKSGKCKRSESQPLREIMNLSKGNHESKGIRNIFPKTQDYIQGKNDLDFEHSF